MFKVQNSTIWLLKCFISLLFLAYNTQGYVKIKLMCGETLKKDKLFNSSIFGTSKNLIDLKGELFSLHYGSIQIGTPSQEFLVAFDTGSADFWVPSTEWHIGEANQYDYRKSLTYTNIGEPAEITYDSGSIIGFLSRDKVILGDTTLDKQIFIEATEEKGNKMDGVAYDSLFGLAFQEASARNLVPAWYKILEKNGVEEKIFSMWLKYYDPADEDKEGGAIIFGGSDPGHFLGDHTFVPIAQPKFYWEFLMGEVIIGGIKTGHCINGCPVIADSGSSVIKGPKAIIVKINKAIGARDKEVDCAKLSTLPRISFTIGERVFHLSPRDYILKAAACSTLFDVNRAEEDINKNNRWILGLPFMRRVHTIFDYENEKIGFADAVQNGD